MTDTTSLNIRKLNQWLKVNVPFHAKAVRGTHMEVIIGCDSSNDLHAFASAIYTEFNESIIRLDAGGLKNYISLIAR